MIVSHSEVESRLLCERRHYYAYGELLEPIGNNIHLFRGVIGHEGLAAFFQTLKDTSNWNEARDSMRRYFHAKLMQQTTAEKIKVVGATQLLIEEFLKHMREEILTWKIIEVEAPRQVVIDDEFTYIYVIDLLFWAGSYFPVDWKFTYDYFSEEIMGLLPQIPKYVGALRLEGLHVPTGYYGFFRYRELKNPKTSDKFRFDRVDISNQRIRRTFEEYLAVARRIAADKAKPLSEWEKSVVRTANKSVCNYCQFRSVCAVELRGDSAAVLKRDYYKKRESPLRKVIDET